MATKKVTDNVGTPEDITVSDDDARKIDIINGGGCSRIRLDEVGRWIDVFTGEEIPVEIGVQMVE